MDAQNLSGDGRGVAVSSDRTKIAFEALGKGPTLILVGGALNDRDSQRPYAAQLSEDFTVFTYDRRGRGQSGNTLPYSANREVEDLDAVLQATGGAAYVFGHSSGAFIALLAAAAGAPVLRLATYEPPYAADEPGDAQNAQVMGKLQALIDAGQAEAALMFFFGTTGMPPAVIEQQRRAPHWPALVAKAPTLIYEYKLKTLEGSARVPIKTLSRISVPLQAMAGGASPEWMRSVSREVANSAPNGSYVEVPGQAHMATPEVIAPILREFFS